MPTLWWLHPVISAARVVEHMAVVWKPVKRSPRAASASMVGVRMVEP